MCVIKGTAEFSYSNFSRKSVHVEIIIFFFFTHVVLTSCIVTFGLQTNPVVKANFFQRRGPMYKWLLLYF